MFGEVCSNHTHSFLWGNETILFDHELECTVSKTVFILFSFIGIAGLVGNALVVLGNWHNFNQMFLILLFIAIITIHSTFCLSFEHIKLH